MNTVAIVGVGLIGTSFALALRKAGFQGQILGVSSPRALEAALERGAISRATSLEQAAAAADLIYLSQPIDGILKTLELLGPIARQDCLITDAGSTKTAIVQKALECVCSASFLGGHPLAGKEQRGPAAADADLFEGRPYVLTPVRFKNLNDELFRSWLHRMGANVIDMSAQEHDAVVAFTSHLPQLVSTALSHSLARENNDRFKSILGPGLISMTRLAMSSPELWRSILETNKQQIFMATERFMKSFAELQEALEKGNLDAIFESAAGFARSISEASNTTEQKSIRKW